MQALMRGLSAELQRARRSFRFPAPRVWSPLRLEDLATFDRQDGHRGLLNLEAVANGVAHHPVAFAHIKHRDVGLTSDGERSQAVLLAEDARRIDRAHGDHLLEREPEPEEAPP